MTRLHKKVRRVSDAKIFEKGKLRNIVVSFEPPCILAMRAQGLRKTYRLTFNRLYMLAAEIDAREAKKARDKARKEKRTERLKLKKRITPRLNRKRL